MQKLHHGPGDGVVLHVQIQPLFSQQLQHGLVRGLVGEILDRLLRQQLPQREAAFQVEGDKDGLLQIVQLLQQGNELLGHVARTATTAVWTQEENREALEAEGWRCWQGTVDAVPRARERGAAYAQRMVDAIGTRSRSVYLTLDDSTATAGVLSAALERFKNEEYTVVTPIETRI